jgi:hypothetical protein
MQSTEEGMRDDAAGPLDRARDRRIFVQRSVRADMIFGKDTHIICH